MKPEKTLFLEKIISPPLILFLILCCLQSISAASISGNYNQNDSLTYVLYRGSVIDADSRNPLVFATLAVSGSNIVTISNTEGQFSLKVPKIISDAMVTISYLGYQTKKISLSDFKKNNVISLSLVTVKLNPITVSPRNPEMLIRAVLNRRNENYYDNPMLMTAFYRETIKKRRTYVSLSEAVVEILKQPINSSKTDFVHLYKARKNTDYSKLDTVAFKLQGGPITNLMLDIMRNPEQIFSDDMLGNYMFNIEEVTKSGDRYLYVLSFKQRPHITIPLYYGNLYIDTETLALTSATFFLNVENRESASQMFLKKKPTGSRVYPTAISYHIDYREINGKWYYGYSRGDLTFKISWKKRLFNRIYDTSIEMLVTDWEKISENPITQSERIKPTIIMSDEISGFADPDFWGEYNVIEPEKPIESAIKKIQKNLEKKK